MNLDKVLLEGAKIYGVELTNQDIERFLKYKDILKEWNNKINLTTITDDYEIIVKHFLDSISLVKCGLLKDGISLIDVGTGAGFPGIPIKILFPGIKVVLLDSLNKRVNFLNEVIEQLKLENIYTVHGRAEDMARDKNYREKYDISTARAVANMTVLSEYCIPFVKEGGYFLAMKGPSVDEELKDGKNAIGTLGGKVKEVIEVELYGEEMNHRIVMIEKVLKTMEKYPRKTAQIQKRPIK